MNTPKTIQIFLPDGDPAGLRMAEITTSVVRVIEFPRAELSKFLSMLESSQVGVYFLFGEDEETEKGKLYIGQSGVLKTRLVQHNQQKDFWSRAVAVTSLTNNLTQTHALYLEWLAIKKAKEADRYSLENGNEGSKPHTPLPLEADCNVIFDVTHTLLGTLGYPVFKSLANHQSDDDELFFCKRKGTSGKGMLTDEGFVILKGSTGPSEVSDLYPSVIRAREAAFNSGSAVIENDQFVFKKDYLFRTPSGASDVLIGKSSNGWIEWKNQAGQTLDEIYRKTDNHES